MGTLDTLCDISADAAALIVANIELEDPGPKPTPPLKHKRSVSRLRNCLLPSQHYNATNSFISTPEWATAPEQ